MATDLANYPAVWSGAKQRVAGALQPAPAIEAYPTHGSANLSSILDQFSPFPPYSLVIGQCTDGLPFMLSLDNPRSGSILVVGEDDKAKMSVLTTMSTSSCRINHPADVSWSLITRRAYQFPEMANSPHCQAVIHPQERTAGELLIEMASIVEQRRFGRERGSLHVLMIDGYTGLSPILSDYSVYLSLKTLVSKGPGRGIWPLVSAMPGDAHTEQGQVLHAFGTYIFEKNTLEPGQNHPPANRRRPRPSLQPNFNVIVGGRLIPICSLSN
ncbi:MAG: hypothetical protein ACWGOY_03485 [Anaerolineales bacterium]